MLFITGACFHEHENSPAPSRNDASLRCNSSCGAHLQSSDVTWTAARAAPDDTATLPELEPASHLLATPAELSHSVRTHLPSFTQQFREVACFRRRRRLARFKRNTVQLR